MHTLRKLYSHFLSNLMGYDHGDSFPFDFEPNGIPFGSENRNEKLSNHDHIPFKVKGNGNIVLSGCMLLKPPVLVKRECTQTILKRRLYTRTPGSQNERKKNSEIWRLFLTRF